MNEKLGKRKIPRKRSHPICEKCGSGGHGIVFNILGPFDFGKYCLACEKAILASGTGSEPE